MESKNALLLDCKIAPPEARYKYHLLLFMHQQTTNTQLIKKPTVRTRLHDAPVFKVYKPNYEKVKMNVLYCGAMD